MRKLLSIIVLLAVVVWLVAEVAAPPFAEGRIEEEVRARSRVVTAASADIGTFPVVARLLATGKVPSLSVTLDEVAGQSLSFSEVRFELRGIELDRMAMFGGDVRVRDIDSGVITVTISASALGRALGGVPVGVTPEHVLVSTPAGGVEVVPTIEDSTLTLNVAGVADLSVTLPDDLLPCVPTLTLEQDRVIVACTVDSPPRLLSGR